MFSLTEGTTSPLLRRSRNDRSKIARHFRDLCGTIATGDTFNCFGKSCLMSSQRTIFACPVRTFSSVSLLSWAMHSSVMADSCGPRSIAASASARVHRRPVRAGHPFVAWRSSVAAAGCPSAAPDGSMFLLRPVGGATCVGRRDPATCLALAGLFLQ